MQWPNAVVVILSWLLSGICGFWFYAMTFKAWRWKKALIKVGYSSFSGAALAMMLLWLRFDAERDGEFVVALCMAGGLCGYNVQTVKHYVRIVLLAVLRNGHNGSHHGSRDSDTPNPYLEENPSD